MTIERGKLEEYLREKKKWAERTLPGSVGNNISDYACLDGELIVIEQIARLFNIDLTPPQKTEGQEEKTEGK